MAKYEGQCGSCEDFKDKRGNCERPYDPSYYEKGYCEWRRAFYYPDDSCSYYKRRSGYYITTAICDLLGLDEDCEIRNVMKNLRDNIMEKDTKYQDILSEYDVVGPQIASNLENEYNEKDDKELVCSLFNFYIQPTVRLCNEGKTDEAISRYLEMTRSLEEVYGITYPIALEDTKVSEKSAVQKVKLKEI